jgi:hypothetical protein
MLQAHSFLWYYLWLAPNLLLIGLAILLWRRGLARRFPTFLAFAILSAVGELAAFLADILPKVAAENFWRTVWVGLLIESLLKFLAIGEIFSQVFHPYPSIGRLGRILVSVFGGCLVLLAALVAAFSHDDNPTWLISGAHILEQTVFFIELGLVCFVFLFAAYFRVSWDRISFGVMLGFGISSCEHLATWAIVANASPSATQRTLFDFLNMATTQLVVLLWSYFVLVPGKVAASSAVPLPENNLSAWNHALERLLHQ